MSRCVFVGPPPTMQSTDTPDTTLHAVGTSAFVGLVVAGLWWACGRCHRSLLLEARLCADTESVYRFLSDPKNLKIIHPTTVAQTVNILRFKHVTSLLLCLTERREGSTRREQT
ncbi:hypothetical protein C0Q70_20666 [Pomacea canaliculata]|uniref:Uncharacterized protein n=1 Tax=Pomacea canaliculata TaxID=400727 RepID=A0A2T7NG73_POMCA|nr:hypothetical protein C0Q70_20666 [Pomacea canaliculata]